MGSIPLFALPDEYLRCDPELAADPPPFIVSGTAGDTEALKAALKLLRDRPDETRRLQVAFREWHARHFLRAPIRERLVRFFGDGR